MLRCGDFYNMLKLKRLFTREDGAAAMEFAFVAIPFLISVLFIMELCRIIYVMSSVDLILSDTSSATAISTTSTNNDADFNRAVNDKAKGWILLLVGDNVQIETSVTYCQSIQDIVDRKCSPAARTPDAATTATLALYRITVPYKPLFFVFPGAFVQNTMTREVVLVQEHKLDRTL